MAKASGQLKPKTKSREDRVRAIYEWTDYYILYWVALLGLTILAVDDVQQHLNSLQHLNTNAKNGIAVIVVGIVLSKLYRRKR
jgi:hypothetical protein